MGTEREAARTWVKEKLTQLTRAYEERVGLVLEHPRAAGQEDGLMSVPGYATILWI